MLSIMMCKPGDANESTMHVQVCYICSLFVYSKFMIHKWIEWMHKFIIIASEFIAVRAALQMSY